MNIIFISRVNWEQPVTIVWCCRGVGLTILTHGACVSCRAVAGEGAIALVTHTVMTTRVTAAHIHLCQHNTVSLIYWWHPVSLSYWWQCYWHTDDSVTDLLVTHSISDQLVTCSVTALLMTVSLTYWWHNVTDLLMRQCHWLSGDTVLVIH